MGMKRIFKLLIFIFVIIIFAIFIKNFINSKKPYYIELELSSINEDFVNLKKFPIFPFFEQNETFSTLILKLYKIKDDEKFKLLILNLTNYNFNWEQTYELRKIIKEIKKKREVICYSDSYNQKSYYLASACSKIYMANGSILQIPGIYTEILFYKELFDSLKIDIFPIQFEEYKSALEILTRKEPSPFYKEQIEKVLNFHYDELKKALIERGFKNPDSLINIGFFYSDDAKKLNLIDDIKYLDELSEYKKHLRRGSLPEIKEFSNNKIAVIGVEGTITSEDYYNPFDKTRTIGKNFVKLLSKIRKDKSVKAVLIRINSPGGSSLMSDMISREIKLLSKEKEVVISMGRVCASGCYYISAYSNKIFSEPFTITGSIGVIFAKVSTDEFYRKKLFINPYILKKGEHSDIFSSRKLSEVEKEGMKNLIHKVYEDFIKVVSEGRKMSIDSVRKLAKGKIYLGEEAYKFGIVDTIGGFLDALNYLKKKYKDVSFEFYSRELDIDLNLFNLGLRENVLFLELLFLFGDFVKP